jgi:nucleotide-binding universal stress UspA family protein
MKRARGTKRPRHILLADDGSKNAARARTFAVAIAAGTGARFSAVYVREPLEKPDDARRKLEATTAAAAAAGVRCAATVVAPPVGITNPGRRIIAAATREGADTIVLGARGTGVLRKLLGSVSSYVVTRAPMSVCVVR